MIEPTPDANPNIARAAIVIDPEDRDTFVRWVVKNTIQQGNDQLETTINCLLGYSSDATQARDAVQGQGMAHADDVFFTVPFYNGREASLAAASNNAAQIL